MELHSAPVMSSKKKKSGSVVIYLRQWQERCCPAATPTLSMSSTDRSLCCADAVLGQERRNIKLINVSRDPDISRCSAQSIVHSRLYTEMLCWLRAEELHRRPQSSSNCTLCHAFGTLRRSRIEIPAVYCCRGCNMG